MIYFIDQSYMKPLEKTNIPDRSTFEIRHYIIHDEVQKRESGSPIHISTNEQINRHVGKSFVQDERVCVLKLELMEMSHSLYVTLCLVSEEWPRVGNGLGSEIRTVVLPCLRRIVQDNSSLMFDLLRIDALPRYHICEWKNGPDD
jgi:hypothetical protein